MSDALNCAEHDEQEHQVELLPARTVLSMFAQGDGVVGAPGVDGIGTLGITTLGKELIPGGGSGNGIGGPGGSSNGGAA